MLIIAVTGTDTSVGKTYVATRLLGAFKYRGGRVSARKPLQSGLLSKGPGDAALLASVTDEEESWVCPEHRQFELDLAPVIAAELLGREVPDTATLVSELVLEDFETDVTLIELAGGLRSPYASDGDGLAFLHALGPDRVVLVSHAGLGALNAVALCVGYLESFRVHVYLNRFDPNELSHQENLRYLVRQGFDVSTEIEALLDALIRPD